jgi:hypothetical protein
MWNLAKMARWLLTLAAFAFALGCEAHGEPAKAKLVTLAQLEAETASLDRISYLGTDKQFHYFKTEAGRYYKVENAQWQPANRDEMIHEIWSVDSLPSPQEPGFEQYVSVRDGKVVLSPLP